MFGFNAKTAKKTGVAPVVLAVFGCKYVYLRRLEVLIFETPLIDFVTCCALPLILIVEHPEASSFSLEQLTVMEPLDEPERSKSILPALLLVASLHAPDTS